jgi:hypothetical protein
MCEAKEKVKAGKESRPRREDKVMIGLGRPTAAKTFTRNNNRGSGHAMAGKQAREGNHPALLRSSSLANPTNQHHKPTRRLILTPLLALIVLSGLAFAATPALAELRLEKFAIGAQNGEGQSGTPDVQAGSHPYALTNTFLLNKPGPENGYMKDLALQLPPGFVGDPNATPKCTYQEFIKGLNRGAATCSNETAVGVSTTFIGVLGQEDVTPTSDPVYNLAPPAGVAAEFGFIVAHNTPIFIDTSVRTGSDYGLTTTVSDIPEAVLVEASKVTIWGVPASPAHDSLRGTCLRNELYAEVSPETTGSGLREGEDELEGPIGPFTNAEPEPPLQPEHGSGCPSSAPQLPLLTNPTSCGTPRTATLGIDDWEEPGVFRSKEASLPELSGCEKLNFSPTLSVTPDKPDASTSSGLKVNVNVPQEATSNPVGLAEADVRDTTVMLPPGVALNPSGANGLEACSSGPGGLAAGQLGSPGNGIGFERFAELPSQPGVSLPIFTSDLPGDIAAKNAVSTGALEQREEVIQPGLNFCANASKIGTVRIKTPLLEHEVTGYVYLAAQEANPFGSLMAIYVVAEDPVSGFVVKLPGEVQLCKGPGEVIAGQICQALGQISTTLSNTPQAPYEEAELDFYGGEKAPLRTPAYCGTYTTETSFVPWSGTPAVHPSAPFTIANGPNGGACPGSSLPFNPRLTGGALNVNAGAFSPFTLTMNRSDGEQNMQSVEAHLPPGLSGILSNVELCPEPQANQGECGPNSLIGETTVSVGVGGDPYTVTGGKFYLTGPYNGSSGCTVGQAGCAPFGITFTVPAKAGPFDLAHTKSFSPACDCILVRGKIEVNPITAALTVTSNPPGTPDAIPTSIEGIPLEIQHINATTTRGNFQFNPTNCNKMEVTGTIHSSENGTDTIHVPFQVTNCQALKFTPKFTVSTSGKTSRAGGASLTLKVTRPSGPTTDQANFTLAKIELPKQLPSRLTTLQRACLAKVFEANPAACPAESDIGHVKVITPELPVPLEGPAYFVSHGGEAFPSVIFVLQGYGVTIDAVSTTYISKSGVTSATLKTIPDAPFTSFELTFPEKQYSALAANGNLCTAASKLKMPTEFIAQNGMAIHESTPISVTGCAKTKAKTLTRAQKLTKALKACKKKAKGQRAACKAAARKRYGPLKKKGKRK